MSTFVTHESVARIAEKEGRETFAFRNGLGETILTIEQAENDGAFWLWTADGSPDVKPSFLFSGDARRIADFLTIDVDAEHADAVRRGVTS